MYSTFSFPPLGAWFFFFFSLAFRLVNRRLFPLETLFTWVHSCSVSVVDEKLSALSSSGFPQFHSCGMNGFSDRSSVIPGLLGTKRCFRFWFSFKLNYSSKLNFDYQWPPTSRSWIIFIPRGFIRFKISTCLCLQCSCVVRRGCRLDRLTGVSSLGVTHDWKKTSAFQSKPTDKYQVFLFYLFRFLHWVHSSGIILK